jgi:hypothetical protein
MVFLLGGERVRECDDGNIYDFRLAAAAQEGKAAGDA